MDNREVMNISEVKNKKQAQKKEPLCTHIHRTSTGLFVDYPVDKWISLWITL